MDNDQKEAFRIHITRQIKALKRDIQAFALNTRPVAPDNAIGRLTRVAAMNNKSIHAAALHTCENRLVRLELTLTRLYESDFGYCQMCEEPIPHQRLMIMPETDYCVHCAEKMD
ncbi:MAG: conjugal transfer protein TraR [Desulfatitalea sp.]|nr:TraR/DksA C4-type zinc finger protein [Desulfatitalea sp.]NNJ99717.1 conjugal transfer protein TraR [Desulfatitalea sp.]